MPAHFGGVSGATPPDMPFVDPNYYKDQFGVEGRMVLLTFGLLSPNKGIEHVLNALPAILDEFPDVIGALASYAGYVIAFMGARSIKA